MQQQLNKLVVPMEGIFASLPALPKNFKDFIVMIAPWLALIFGALGLLGSLAALGITTFFSPAVMMGAGAGVVAGLTISVILALASSVLTLASVPGLFNKKIMGWNLIFLSEVVSVISSVVMFSVFGIFFSLVGFYVLFQIKNYYKK